MAVNILFSKTLIEHELNVDSRALRDTITTLHECLKYCLRHTVQRLRDRCKSEELNVMRWIPSKINISNALGKRSVMYQDV